jgi:predicted enzyme related to lactoylglutathione lyase
MAVRGVDFVVVNVADIDAAVRFYREVAGVTAPLLEYSDRWMELDLAPVALAFGHDTINRGVNAAIALGVDDVDATIELLRVAGRPVLIEPCDTGGCRSALVTDPDGNLLLIHRRHDGTTG